MKGTFIQQKGRYSLRTTLSVCLSAVMLLSSTTAAFAERWHVHNGACYEKVLTCGQEEQESHVHTDACYTQEKELVCTQTEQEAHSHSDACYADTPVLTCLLPEGEGHCHGEACFVTRSVLTCTEEHSHSESCYTAVTELTCLLPEGEGHRHTQECYTTERACICGLEETPGHRHTEACYRLRETMLACGLEAGDGHTHSEACYTLKLTCKQPEGFPVAVDHENPDKDLETEEDWLATLPKFEPDVPRLTRLLAIVNSQIGYHDSGDNVVVYSDGSRSGYSRYGEWYGIPHGEWCAMFLSFCLHYAGIEEDVFPRDHATVTWMWTLQELGLYVDRWEHRDFCPQPGDLIFFMVDDCVIGPGHVGIVIEADDNGFLWVVEGNHGNEVAQISYWQSDWSIAGYGIMPGELREELAQYEAGLPACDN